MARWVPNREGPHGMLAQSLEIVLEEGVCNIKVVRGQGLVMFYLAFIKDEVC